MHSKIVIHAEFRAKPKEKKNISTAGTECLNCARGSKIKRICWAHLLVFCSRCLELYHFMPEFQPKTEPLVC